MFILPSDNTSSPAVRDATISIEPCSPPTDMVKLLNETQPRQDKKKQVNKTKDAIINKQDDSQIDQDGVCKIQDGSFVEKGQKLSVTFDLEVEEQKPAQNLTNMKVSKTEAEDEDDSAACQTAPV